MARRRSLAKQPYRGGRENKTRLALVIATYGDTCHLCGLPGANSQDHLIPWSWTHDDSLANLRPAHVTCNSRRGNRALPGYGAEVVIVMGPPAAGKTTYVREHAQPNDVVIDFDVIARALGSDPDRSEYAHPTHVAWVARAARKAAIERAMRLSARCTVWVIHAMPSPRDLDDYRFMRYRIEVIDPGYDVVRERAAALRPASFLSSVSTWYAAYANVSSTPARATTTEAPEPTPTKAWW